MTIKAPRRKSVLYILRALIMRRDPRVREAGLIARSELDAGVDGHGTYLTAPPGFDVLLEYPD